MTKNERNAMLKGAAYMREKIAQALETNPRKAIYEMGPSVRGKIKLPAPEQVEKAGEWVEADVAAEVVE